MNREEVRACVNQYCQLRDPQKAFENYKYHDKDSSLLLGAVKPEDRIIQGAQKSFQKEKKRHPNQ